MTFLARGVRAVSPLVAALRELVEPICHGTLCIHLSTRLSAKSRRTGRSLLECGGFFLLVVGRGGCVRSFWSAVDVLLGWFLLGWFLLGGDLSRLRYGFLLTGCRLGRLGCWVRRG